MTYLTALLPVVDGVGVHVALTRYAASATAAGDPRGRGALMVDELVARLLQADAGSVVTAADGVAVNGVPARIAETAAVEQAVADRSDLEMELDVSELEEGDVEPAEYLLDGLSALPAGVSVEIQLVMTDRTLFDGDDEPAILTGYGPIPAPLARHLARGADARTKAWVRRLYADRDTGRLTGCDSRRRLFSHADRQFLIARDQVCRTPWCGAPIRHADHTRPYAAGGATEVSNGAGRCVACNQIKETPGWSAETERDGTIIITTPTGQEYRSRPPEPPRSEPWAEQPPALAVA